jgi:diketogulonate reductase-like aldo/keto reductase
VKQIATKYGKTPVQVLLNWGVNRGHAVIPKSVTPSRIKDNLVYFEMDQEDIDAITELGKDSHIRTCSPVALWGDDCDVFGEGK